VTTNVANVNLNGRGHGDFSARDPEAAYGGMVDHLVCAVTDAFREHYVLREVPKDYVETASAGE
jgi:hypothetical protein